MGRNRNPLTRNRYISDSIIVSAGSGFTELSILPITLGINYHISNDNQSINQILQVKLNDLANDIVEIQGGEVHSDDTLDFDKIFLANPGGVDINIRFYITGW